MGHERTGTLPKTQRWTEVVRQIAEFGGAETQSLQIANDSLENVRGRFESVQRDPAVQAAFKFLTSLGAASQPEQGASAQSQETRTPFTLARELSRAVEQSGGAPEYAAIATPAARDAIAQWYASNRDEPSLFGSAEQNADIWRKTATGAGFCEVARLFFAKFTERYLNYFLEREASAACRTIEDRDLLTTQLREHVDSVSRHAFETAKIAQSFAAGWYNRHALDRVPTDREVEGFLAIAFGKLREDLRRERVE